MLEAYLEKLIQTHPAADTRLQEAICYAVKGNGKRFRPHLVLRSAKLFGIAPEAALPVAAALEFIHCYSLVHDDLPGMDNSPLRRGKPSCWAAFDESTAILVGDSLLTLAFETLATAPLDPATCLRLIQKISKAANAMVGGQMLDMTSKLDWTLDDIATMQNLKTGALIAVSCEAGAVIANQSQEIQQNLYDFGLLLGLIFQITDDLMDVMGDATTIGKPVKQDAEKQTFVQRLGIDGAWEKIYSLQALAEEKLTLLPQQGLSLRELLEERIRSATSCKKQSA